MAAVLTMSYAICAAALTPVLLRLAEAAAHRPINAVVPVRLALAAVLAAFGAAAGARLDIGHALALLPVVVLAGAAALVDAYERRLPDVLTGSLAAASLTAIGVALAADHAEGMRALWGFGGGLMLSFGGKALSTAAVGWGDVKLAPSLTACLAWGGWSTVYVGLLAWAILILATSALLVVRSGRAAIVPYGPAMITGTLLAVLIT